MLGTTHADTFNGPVPSPADLTAEQCANDYEYNTGRVIVDMLERGRPRRPSRCPAALVAGPRPLHLGRHRPQVPRTRRSSARPSPRSPSTPWPSPRPPRRPSTSSTATTPANTALTPTTATPTGPCPARHSVGRTIHEQARSDHAVASPSPHPLLRIGRRPRHLAARRRLGRRQRGGCPARCWRRRPRPASPSSTPPTSTATGAASRLSALRRSAPRRRLHRRDQDGPPRRAGSGQLRRGQLPHLARPLPPQPRHRHARPGAAALPAERGHRRRRDVRRPGPARRRGRDRGYGVSVETSAQALSAIARPARRERADHPQRVPAEAARRGAARRAAAGVGIIARVPLASGLLSGQVRPRHDVRRRRPPHLQPRRQRLRRRRDLLRRRLRDRRRGGARVLRARRRVGPRRHARAGRHRVGLAAAGRHDRHPGRAERRPGAGQRCGWGGRASCRRPSSRVCASSTTGGSGSRSTLAGRSDAATIPP